MRYFGFAATVLALLTSCNDEKQAGRSYRDAAQRMVAARAYLEDIAQQKEARSTASGLLYTIETQVDTNTASPGPHDAVLIHYRARLTDGYEIDSSYERNAPARFAMGTLLAGLREGMALMRPGDRFTFYLPPQLAYGARGRDPIIPANAAMIYEVELLEVEASAS
ncbi:MAG: FKBP-type peptidyl-prolyl cis-trans isomerase [Pseudomonadota bacterium]